MPEGPRAPFDPGWGAHIFPQGMLDVPTSQMRAQGFTAGTTGHWCFGRSSWMLQKQLESEQTKCLGEEIEMFKK